MKTIYARSLEERLFEIAKRFFGTKIIKDRFNRNFFLANKPVTAVVRESRQIAHKIIPIIIFKARNDDLIDCS